MTWTPPPIWSVPREWEGDRAFVLCGGESVKHQRHLISQIQGRVLAVKEGVYLAPCADCLFFAGEHAELVAPPLLKVYSGPHIVVRGKGHPVFPPHAKRIGRTLDHIPVDVGLSDDPSLVAGFDAGTSAINLAYLFGAREIIVLGMDMHGGRWFTGEIDHHLPVPHEWQHQKHMEPLPAIAEDAKRKGVRIVNVSPTSRVECFERGRLEDFL